MNNDLTRLPPHSLDAETSLLASLMLDDAARSEQLPLLRLDDFFAPDHGIIFTVLADMARRHRPVDGVLLIDELAKRQLLDEVGGQAYIGQILNSVPNAAHAAHYARVVREKAKLRAAIAIAHDVIRQAYAPTDGDAGDVILRDMARAADEAAACGVADTIVSLERAVADVLTAKGSGVLTRRLTGLAELDAMTGGVPIGGMTIVAAPAGMGKSQLGRQVVKNIGTGVGHPDNAVPCGIVAAEEPIGKIVDNYLAGVSGVQNSRVVYNRDLTPADWNKLYAAGEHLRSLPIFVDDAQRQLSRVEATIRRMVRRHGCQVIVVDHLHLLDGEARGENRTAEVTKLSGALKALFKELKVCGIVVCQVNRTADPLEAPELRHLRDSGSLEADGDLILQLRRRDYVAWRDDPDGYVPDHRLEVFVNKNKAGAMGVAELWFDGDRQTVTDWNGGHGPNVPDCF